MEEKSTEQQNAERNLTEEKNAEQQNAEQQKLKKPQRFGKSKKIAVATAIILGIVVGGKQLMNRMQQEPEPTEPPNIYTVTIKGRAINGERPFEDIVLELEEGQVVKLDPEKFDIYGDSRLDLNSIIVNGEKTDTFTVTGDTIVYVGYWERMKVYDVSGKRRAPYATLEEKKAAEKAAAEEEARQKAAEVGVGN